MGIESGQAHSQLAPHLNSVTNLASLICSVKIGCIHLKIFYQQHLKL